jgi:hypothetical protein
LIWPWVKAERRVAGGGMRLVSDAVGRLLRGRAVEAPAVRLDYETKLGPAEVDAEPVDVVLRLWEWQARSTRDR